MSSDVEILLRLLKDQNQELAVQMGRISGFSVARVYGENPDIDSNDTPSDLWESGGAYPYDQEGTAPIVSLISDDTSDDVLIGVAGLDIEGKYSYQEVQLNGTTRVPLTTPLWRVLRLSNEGSVDLDGRAYCYIGEGGVPSLINVRSTIAPGNNHSLLASYTVPLGSVGFLYRVECGMSRTQANGEIHGAFFTREHSKVFKVKKRMNLTNQGSAIYQDRQPFPEPLAALTDVKVSALAVSANNSGMWAALDILLIDESFLSADFLHKIRQPGY